MQILPLVSLFLCGIPSFLQILEAQELPPDDQPIAPSSGARMADDGFAIISSGRRRGAANAFGSSLTSSNASDSMGNQQSQFPDYFRVEVEIQRLENPDGVLKAGGNCDVLNRCDPVVSAYIDTSKPNSPWPGLFPVSRWPIIFEATNNNSPDISRVLSQDICGGSLSTVNARVRVADADDTSSNDDIGDFECVFSVSPGDVGQPNTVRWGSSTACPSTNGQASSRLFARIRTFEIPSTSCRVATN